jgi:prepilin-type N-terminal cleavage/methylation domain-containing protein
MAIKRLQAGVTLIEMLIVVAIIAVVSSVIMFNYSDFSSNVSVRNLSQEIALAVRKAQTYATSVRPIEGTNSVSSASFPGYGIVFTTDNPTVAVSSIIPTWSRFVLFADIADAGGSDRVYGADTVAEQCGTPTSSQNECIETFDIASADRIVAICDDSVVSSDIAGCQTTGTASISFRRPSPDAYILYNGQPTPYVQIVLESAKKLRRSIVVWNTGQISVQ